MAETPQTDAWTDTLNKKISDLDLVASWASMVGYSTVADKVRGAVADLRHFLDIRQESLKKSRKPRKPSKVKTP